MTPDYFAALAARVVHPGHGIQPRRRTIFDAPAARPPAEGEPPALTTASGPAEDRTVTESGSYVQPSQRAPGEEPAIPSDSSAPHGDARTGDASLPREKSGETGRGQPRQELVHAGTARQPAAVTARTPASPAVPDTVADRTRQVVDVVPHVRSFGDANAPDAAAASRAGSDHEPVIQVHIGRVDVRAVLEPPAAPSAPRGTKPGLMSLDEYVRQRRGAQP